MTGEANPVIARNWKVALVGITGPHSRGWLETLRSLDEVRDLLVCDVDAESTIAAPATATHPGMQVPEDVTSVSFDALLTASGGPDMALLSVRNDQAPDLGELLLRAGIPCIIEKPSGRTSADIERLNGAAAAGGTIWAPGFLNRLQPAARRIRRLVSEGALGHILSIEARMVTSSVNQRNPEHWLFRKEIAGGGILHWLAIHTIDLIRYLTGQEFADVSGHVRTFTRGIDVEDMAALTFTLKGGAVGNLHAGYILRQRYGDIGITLRGDLGEIVWPQWGFEGRQDTIYLHNEGPQSDGSGPEIVTLTPPEGAGYGGGLGQQFVRSFMHASRMGGRFITDGHDALCAMRLVEAAYAASGSGLRVAP
ncbi:MAG: Gfo/Idh/MocA family oxidoreductase [bacterium]|nr:Gfo/Idh/MocA family oxidoreductase [bacterium]